jgi:hypothetical protein
VPLLGEDSDWEVAFQWYGGGLGVSGLDAADGGDPTKLPGVDCALRCLDHLVHPFGWGTRVGLSLAYPVTCLGRLLK